MASFTDDPKALSKFNPYIQQLPVEQMIEVGRRRQAAHDEGVQKIQSQIDNIAGLDVVRDVDKAYLQSKLNQLGNNLRMVAAGDFSNFQMVNHVTGMTNQIIRDKGIQNGVQSAARYRKEIAAMETAEKEGKGSIANRWVFGQDSQAWLNSDDVNEGFNAKYQQYIDVNKKWMEVMKGLHSDLSEQDIPYERNSDGSINYSKTAAAMQRLSKETVSAAKIENALRSSLTPDEMNQLTIDGRYSFRQYNTPESMINYSNEKFSKLISTNNDRIRSLNGLISLSSSNPTLKKQAQDSIASLEIQNKQLQEQYDEEVQMISANPDLAKGIIYKNGAIAQFAMSNSWEHNKSNLLENPVLKTEQWNKTHALDLAKFNLSVRSQNWSEWKDRATLDLAERDFQLKAAKQHAEIYGTATPIITYGGKSTKIKDPYTAMVNEAKGYDKEASAGIIELVKAMPGTNSVQIKEALRKYQAGDPNWFKLGGNSKQIIPVEYREIADGVIKAQKSSRLITSAMAKVEAEAKNAPEVANVKVKLREAVKDLPNLTAQDSAGRKVTFTRAEVLEYLDKKITANSTQTRANLTSKEKMLDSNTLRFFGKDKSLYSTYVDRTGDLIVGRANKISKRIRDGYDEISGGYLPKQTTMAFGSGEGNIARRTWEGFVAGSLAEYGKHLNEAGDVGGAEGFDEDDIATAKKWISSDKRDNIIYSKIEQGNKTYISMVKDGEEIVIPVKAHTAINLPSGGAPQYSYEYKEVAEAQRMGKGSTNPSDKFENCHFDNTNIRGTSFNVGADLKWNVTNKDKQYIQLKLNTPIGILPLTLDNPVDRQQGINLIKGLDDRQIKQAYLSQPDSVIPKEWKQVINNL